MAKSVRIADLKAHLSEHLRAVRRGHPITVLDRDTPIATIEPIRHEPPPLRVRKATRDFRDIELPPPLGVDIDVVALLREDRDKR